MKKDEEDFYSGMRGGNTGRYTLNHQIGSNIAGRDHHTGDKIDSKTDPNAGVGLIIIALAFGCWIIYDSYAWVRVLVWWVVFPGLIIWLMAAMSKMETAARFITVGLIIAAITIVISVIGWLG